MEQFQSSARIILCSLLGIVLVGWGVVFSASGDYHITWWTVNGGGGISNGGEYQLHGTSGQSDAGVSLQGGSYRLHGGFWHAPTAPRVAAIYLPLIMATTPVEGQPDLVGELRLIPDQTAFAAGEAVTVEVTVRNTGDAPSMAAWADLYINPSETPDVNRPWNTLCGLEPCFGVTWIIPPLAAGESITLTTTPDSYAGEYSLWSGWFAAGTTNVQLYVDVWNADDPLGAVVEGNESNNHVVLDGLTVTGTNPELVLQRTADDIPERPVMP